MADISKIMQFTPKKKKKNRWMDEKHHRPGEKLKIICFFDLGVNCPFQMDVDSVHSLFLSVAYLVKVTQAVTNLTKLPLVIFYEFINCIHND